MTCRTICGKRLLKGAIWPLKPANHSLLWPLTMCYSVIDITLLCWSWLLASGLLNNIHTIQFLQENCWHYLRGADYWMSMLFWANETKPYVVSFLLLSLPQVLVSYSFCWALLSPAARSLLLLYKVHIWWLAVWLQKKKVSKSPTFLDYLSAFLIHRTIAN